MKQLGIPEVSLVPAGNLRGRLTTDDLGRFEFETIVPPSYGIPDNSATAKLLGAWAATSSAPATSISR